MKIILFICVLLATLISSRAFSKDYVYIIRGNIVDIHSGTFKSAAKKLESEVRREMPKATIVKFHNSKWKKECRRLKEAGFKTGDRYFFIGHSWGVQASFDIARCLQQTKGKRGKLIKRNHFPIELVISVDPIQKFFKNDIRIVPSNIKNVESFYQTQDIFLKGAKRLISTKDASTRVFNYFVKVDGNHKAHDKIFAKLVHNKRILKVLRNYYH